MYNRTVDLVQILYTNRKWYAHDNNIYIDNIEKKMMQCVVPVKVVIVFTLFKGLIA